MKSTRKRRPSNAVRWKPAANHYVESHCGRWWITPIYGGLTRPERYELRHNATGAVGGWKVVGGGQTQSECKRVAEVHMKSILTSHESCLQLTHKGTP